ncbi:peptide deformylase [Patescibacteria group bacterium]|nr:peptide deformylase [Patescibacteria group bacterium]
MKKGKPHSPLIRVEGDPVLRAKAAPVPQSMFGTPELEKILADMVQALRDEPFGVAIAAPQVGYSYRIFVVRGYVLEDRTRDDPQALALRDVAFINPTITYRSEKKQHITGEGCLSLPNIYGDIVRSERVRVSYQDERGKKFLKSGSGLLAEIFEHECDHLDGILFADTATNLHEGTA